MSEIQSSPIEEMPNNLEDLKTYLGKLNDKLIEARRKQKKGQILSTMPLLALAFRQIISIARHISVSNYPAKEIIKILQGCTYTDVTLTIIAAYIILDCSYLEILSPKILDFLGKISRNKEEIAEYENKIANVISKTAELQRIEINKNIRDFYSALKKVVNQINSLPEESRSYYLIRVRAILKEHSLKIKEIREHSGIGIDSTASCFDDLNNISKELEIDINGKTPTLIMT